ncbi:integrase core domain-containing protein [Hirsutella rhossiliensis]
MEAEACAERFLWCFARYHWWPDAITSDRGSNWVGRFWRHMCKLLGIDQQLSTAYHPQTDGGPERMNQEVQAYLRAVINQNQNDWDKLRTSAKHQWRQLRSNKNASLTDDGTRQNASK